MNGLDHKIFKSFWMAGFECTDQLNHYGDRVDLLRLTGHIDLIATDYELLRTVGIQTVREGIRWSQVERQPGIYDFSVVGKMMHAAQEQGIQQLWDICHFGYPDDLSPLHPHFTKRFVGICSAFAQYVTTCHPTIQLIVTPINEVGFISWLGGEEASTVPYARGMGWEMKYALMRAYIEGVKALKLICPSIKIMTTEPIVNVVPPIDPSPEQLENASASHLLQYQAMDILTGKICPELGGSNDLVDYMGYNYYYNNQWIADTHISLPWANLIPDPRWRGLSSLLEEAYLRYNKPLVLAETSHPGEHRPNWIASITRECIRALKNGVPLEGICLYPIIDRPDWDHLHYWHHSGLWDADAANPFDRRLNQPYARMLKAAQRSIQRNVNEPFYSGLTHI